MTQLPLLPSVERRDDRYSSLPVAGMARDVARILGAMIHRPGYPMTLRTLSGLLGVTTMYVELIVCELEKRHIISRVDCVAGSAVVPGWVIRKI